MRALARAVSLAATAATVTALARDQGVSGYIGDGANRWPAVHRLDAAHLFRLAVEKAPAGSRLHAVADEGVPLRAIAEDIPLDIVYEDEFLAVINKPAGMVVHPGAGVQSGTLANAVGPRPRTIQDPAGVDALIGATARVMRTRSSPSWISSSAIPDVSTNSISVLSLSSPGRKSLSCTTPCLTPAFCAVR